MAPHLSQCRREVKKVGTFLTKKKKKEKPQFNHTCSLAGCVVYIYSVNDVPIHGLLNTDRGVLRRRNEITLQVA